MAEVTVDICVLLSTFGGSQFLPALEKSLGRQTTRGLVVVRNDDGDNCDHLGIRGSLRVLLSTVPAQCPYVVFCDQDDVWFSRKLEILRRAMLEAEALGSGPILVHGDAFVTDEHLRILRRRFVSRWARHSDFFSTLMFHKVQGASMMINRPLLELIRDLPEEAPVYDRYIHLVAEICGRRVFIDRPLMYYRQHGRNAMGAFGKRPKFRWTFLDSDELRLYAGNEYVLQKFGDRLDSKKRPVVRDYRKLFTTKNPLVRLALIYRHLLRFPGPLLKRTVKVWLP